MATTFDRSLRKCFAALSLVVSSVAVAIPDPVYAKIFMALATGMNAASLYLLKENNPVTKQ